MPSMALQNTEINTCFITTNQLNIRMQDGEFSSMRHIVSLARHVPGLTFFSHAFLQDTFWAHWEILRLKVYLQLSIYNLLVSLDNYLIRSWLFLKSTGSNTRLHFTLTSLVCSGGSTGRGRTRTDSFLQSKMTLYQIKHFHMWTVAAVVGLATRGAGQQAGDGLCSSVQGEILWSLEPPTETNWKLPSAFSVLQSYNPFLVVNATGPEHGEEKQTTSDSWKYTEYYCKRIFSLSSV